uniref:BHLH domain-containing protein n=1 Tax=Angiostrongylus cantonensis TaxID=6313 RepID=A0A0K0D100_ANGCA
MTRHSSSSSSPDENRRLRSTLKEKKRNIEINEAFERLQKQLPHVPTSTRLPKIKTLRLALKYIEHLNTILSGDKQVTPFFVQALLLKTNQETHLICVKNGKKAGYGKTCTANCNRRRKILGTIFKNYSEIQNQPLRNGLLPCYSMRVFLSVEFRC